METESMAVERSADAVRRREGGQPPMTAHADTRVTGPDDNGPELVPRPSASYSITMRVRQHLPKSIVQTGAHLHALARLSLELFPHAARSTREPLPTVRHKRSSQDGLENAPVRRELLPLARAAVAMPTEADATHSSAMA